MGIHGGFTVMVSGYGALLVVSLLAGRTSASICAQGKQYLSTKLETCVNCTECAKGDVVLRPCEIHRDTLCGPISELLKFMQPNNGGGGGNPHRHKHHHHQRHRASGHDADIVWKYGDDVDGGAGHRQGLPGPPDVTSSEAPFSGAEALVWDWQAIALTSAVFACILFFLVITLYSLHQAKQWRRLKDNFEADVEELSARLSLMAAANEKGEILEPRIGPISDGNYLNNRCVYLEQLLNVRKDTRIGSEGGGGNVYIEESSSASPGGGRA